MYVDGAPVPGTSIPLEGSSSVNAALQLVATVSLPAGAHTADARVDCPSGAPGMSLGDSRPAWTVLLLGDS